MVVISADAVCTLGKHNSKSTCSTKTFPALRVYVHCTAGLGRAPAVCIAYLYWWCGMNLDDAYQYLTNIRPCGPKVCCHCSYEQPTSGCRRHCPLNLVTKHVSHPLFISEARQCTQVCVVASV